MWSALPDQRRSRSSSPNPSRPGVGRNGASRGGNVSLGDRSVREVLGMGVPTAAVCEATRSLAVMLKARLPLVDALRTTQEQCDDDMLANVLREVVAEVEGGRALADALEDHPKAFTTLYVHLVRVGERAGILDSVLLQLAEYLDRRETLKRKVRLAFVYPGLILTVALGATIFLLTVIVPTFADVFASFNADLPGPTQWVLAVSTTLREDGLLLAAALLGGAWLVRAGLRTESGGRLRDTLALRLPLLGPLVAKTLTARFCRTLGTLLENGVDLAAALDIQVRAASNVLVKEDLKAMTESVRRGSALTAAVETSPVFPVMVVKMIQAGEKTAELDTMLLRAAEHYEDDVEDVAETLSSIVEPVLIVLIGLVLGGILVSIYLPMFDMVNVVQ